MASRNKTTTTATIPSVDRMCSRTASLIASTNDGESRQLDAHAGENLLELGNHHDHQQNQDAHRHDEHGHRIKQRGLDLALDLLRFFGKFRQAFQHHFQHAAQFARP